MSKQFAAGDRVRVSNDYHWATGALGTVVRPPDGIVQMFKGWNGISLETTNLTGKQVSYWVKFDERQTDSDGDGAYAEAEMDAEFLIFLSSGPDESSRFEGDWHKEEPGQV
jgi:hypothetical protein